MMMGLSLAWILLLGYVALLWYSLWEMSSPSIACSQQTTPSWNCVRPLVYPGDDLAMELWVFAPEETPPSKWKLVESCLLNVTLPSSGVLPQEVTSDEKNCTLTLPEASRVRWSDQDSRKGAPLRARFRFRRDEKIVAEVPFLLTRIAEQSHPASFFSSSARTRRNLLNEPVANESHKDSSSVHKYIPYFKYGSQPIVLRFVAESRPFGGPPFLRKDGVELLPVPWNQTVYRPILYVDENALQRHGQSEMAPPEEAHNKPPVSLRIQIGTISPMRDALNRQLIAEALSKAEAMLGESEMDEFRYWLRDERLYRFILTQIISFVHVWVDYMAFRDEVSFYKGKTDFAGVSVSSVITRCVCSIIIFLYLLDGGGTSWVVLLSVFSGVAVDSWKAWRLLRPTPSRQYPFVTFRATQSRTEQTTARYDAIAITYLALFFYPLVIGWAIYALYHYTYTSWYSWLISNLANAVYTFGFIALCPQLYVNYRLKTVAHLPWKVFVYKVFNTFVDDVFAFLIDMPWKHRIMTLRDDVVFVLFLVQAFMYRVDKTRRNEYGYSYEEKEKNHTDVASDHMKDKID